MSNESLRLTERMSGMLMNVLVGFVIVFLIVAASSEKTEAVAETMEE